MPVQTNSRYSRVDTFLDASRNFRSTDVFRFEIRRDIVDFSGTPNEEFILYKVRDGDDFENLAFRFYRDSTLWWVIADANRALKFSLDFTTGDVLRIPPARSIQGLIGS